MTTRTAHEVDEITAIMLEQIQQIEQRDEGQILAELAGETINEYVYEIKQWDGKKKQEIRKVKLSWVGVKEVARSRGNIVLSEPTINDVDGAVRIVVKATDLKRNFTVFGGCHQPNTMKVTDKDTGEVKIESDPFFFQKALSKSQRNALNLCIPGDYAAKCIDRFLRLAGKTPLLPQGKPTQLPKGNGSKLQVKPLEEWEQITKDQVPDLPTLERIGWNLTKLQPYQMYKELGYTSRADVTEPAWDCFLRLKDRYAPIDSEAVGVT